jgi:hypothetical protein
MEFLSPLFLAGLAAGAIPLVIHLLNRRRARLLPIATLRFLRLIPARTIRRRRLEEYVLLAARVLVLCLLAIGAAQPVLRAEEAGGGATGLVIVLDDSYSMEYRVSGVTRLQKAAEAAVGVCRSLSGSDRAALLLASSPAGEILAKDAAEAMKRRAGAAKCGTFAGSLLPAVRKGLELLGEAPEPNRELVIVTDLTRRAVEPLAGKLDEVDRSIRVVVVDVGAEDAANLSVTRVDAGSGMAIAGEPVRVTTTVRNRRRGGTAARVSLVVGEERVAERTVALEDPGDLAVQLTAVVDAPGAVGGRVVLEGDNLVRDDTRHFVLPVAGRIPVLLVNGDPSPVTYQDETFFLRAALAPEEFKVHTVESPVNLAVVEPDALVGEDLGPFLAVILANVPRLEDAAAHRLVRFVKGGGGLLVFGGNRVDPRLLNDALGTDPELGALPAELGPATGSAEELVGVAEVDEAHPLFSGLSEEALRDLHRVHARSALGADARAAGGTVVVSLEDGRPLLVEKRAGRGKVLLFTVSADADWGNLPIRPIFLPLLHRAIRYVAGTGSAKDGFVIGEPVRVPPPSPGAPAPEVVDPEGRTRLLGPARDSDGFLLYDPPPLPGVYRVKGSGAGEEYFFALNVDAEEGDLSRADPSALTGVFRPASVRVLRDPTELSASLVRSREGQPLWSWFLGAALLLLLFEGLFANRIATARARRDEEERRTAA